MDREKLKTGNEILSKIAYWNELISSLELSNCVSFRILKDGVDRQAYALYEGGNNSDLLEIAIGSVIAEVKDKIRDLDDEFDKL